MQPEPSPPTPRWIATTGRSGSPASVERSVSGTVRSPTASAVITRPVISDRAAAPHSAAWRIAPASASAAGSLVERERRLWLLTAIRAPPILAARGHLLDQPGDV